MNKTGIVISGTGLFIPPFSISNEELVASYNRYVVHHNDAYKAQIEKGEHEPLQESSTAFIEKASGIKSRYVIDKIGVLDPTILHPLIAERADDVLSVQAEMAVNAAREALTKANKKAEDVDLLIVACSNLQRAYPAVSIEVQQALGCVGYAFDMNVACSSATFGIKTAVDALINKTANTALVINPEICSAHLEFHDRDCHFIFGDVCTAVVLQRKECIDSVLSKKSDHFEIVSTKLKTQFSNNIRNNFGFLNRCSPETQFSRDKTFRQNGRKVFKEVVSWVSELILDHLGDESISSSKVKRLWLHQANINMNDLIARKVFGRDYDELEAPNILKEFANTSSAGSIVAFHRFHNDLQSGDIGVICSFGAGYSAGSILLMKE